MIDYNAVAISIGAMFLAVLAVALIAGRRRPKKIVPDAPLPQPEPWYCEYTRGPNGEA